jgi:hypothetical protein
MMCHTYPLIQQNHCPTGYDNAGGIGFRHADEEAILQK